MLGQQLAGVLGLVLIILMVGLGAAGAPWWTPLIAAPVGVILYVQVKGGLDVFRVALARSGVWLWAQFYVAQAVTCGIAFGLGLGLRYAFGAL